MGQREPAGTNGASIAVALPQARVPVIDALRGVACLWVVLHHARLYGLWRELPPEGIGGPLASAATYLISAVAAMGYLGVACFLVLSGFCLSYPLARRQPLQEARLDWREFARRRAKRILPPYYAALALFVPLALSPALPLNHPRTWWDIPAHVLLLHNLSPVTINGVNGSFWSLALEAQFYCLFPLLLGLVRRAGLGAVVVGSFALALVWRSILWACWGDLTPGQWELGAATYYSVPGRLCQFTCGMVAAALVARPRPGQTGLARAVFVVLTPLALWESNRHIDQFGIWSDPLWGIVFAALVVWAAGAPAERLTRGAGRTLTALGTISFSVYLIHQPLEQLTRFLLPDALAAEPLALNMALLFVFLPLLLLVGWLFYRCVEAPRPAPAAGKTPPAAAPPCSAALLPTADTAANS